MGGPSVEKNISARWESMFNNNRQAQSDGVNTKMVIKGAIWDMDGVLVDSGPFHLEAWQVTLRKAGMELTADQFNTLFGMDNRRMMTILLGHPPREEFLTKISAEKEVLYRSLLHGKAVPYPGVMLWLKHFRSKGVRQALASSAPPENVEALVRELGLSNFMEYSLSALGEGLPGKPSPAIFLRAAELLNLPVESCVVFEDSIAGVEAAKSGGFYCVAITSTNPREKLTQADWIIDRFSDLPADLFQYKD